MEGRVRAVVFLSALAIGLPADAAPKVETPPEIAAHVPADLRSYFIVFKTTPAVPKEMSADVFERHQAYIREQIGKKVYQLVGPLTDGGRVRGITILTASSLEEARRIVEGDPAVQEKVLDIEVHPAVFPNLDSLRVEYPPAAN
jgi:uncharacterized protein YciI